MNKDMLLTEIRIGDVMITESILAHHYRVLGLIEHFTSLWSKQRGRMFLFANSSQYLNNDGA